MNTFNTEVNIQIIENERKSYGSAKANISWELEIEAKKWGVKNFNVTVPDQTVECLVERIAFDGKKTWEEYAVINIQDAVVDIAESRLDLIHLLPHTLKKNKNKFVLEFL